MESPSSPIFSSKIEEESWLLLCLVVQESTIKFYSDKGVEVPERCENTSIKKKIVAETIQVIREFVASKGCENMVILKFGVKSSWYGIVCPVFDCR
jgi:hypothetical protein